MSFDLWITVTINSTPADTNVILVDTVYVNLKYFSEEPEKLKRVYLLPIFGLIWEQFEYAESTELPNKENWGITAKGRTIPCLTDDLLPNIYSGKEQQRSTNANYIFVTSKEIQKTKKYKRKCKE